MRPDIHIACRYRPALALALVPLLLSGCLAQSRIQGKYLEAESKCREQAQQVAQANPAAPEGAAPADGAPNPVLAAFSDCITKSGWKLSTPKPATATASNTPPTLPGTPKPSIVPSAPPALAASRAAPAPAAAAAPAAAEGGFATYQPARPSAGPAPAYGEGAGRNF